MIETIQSSDIEGRSLQGLFVLGGLSLGIGRACFPGTPLFVEKSTAAGHHCRKIHVRWDDAGAAASIGLASKDWDDHSTRVRNEYVRFVCETEEEVISLLNTRGRIMEIMDRRGFLNDSALGEEILGIIAEAAEGEAHGPPSA